MWEFGIFIFNFYIAFNVMPSSGVSKDYKLLMKQLKLREVDLSRGTYLDMAEQGLFHFLILPLFVCSDDPGCDYYPNPWNGVKENEKGLCLVTDMFVSMMYLRPVTCKDVLSTKCVSEAKCLRATMDENDHGDR